MTVSTQVAQQLYTGNGAATNFPWSNMKVLDADHINVSTIVIATGVVTAVPSSAYTVNGVGSDAGSIDYNPGPALPSTHQLLVERIVPYTQDVDIDNEGGFLPEVIEKQLDLMVMQTQQLLQAVADLVAGGTGVSLSGMISGPAVAVADNFASFNGTSGVIIKDSGRKHADYALAAHTHTFASLTSKPITHSGYGIVDFDRIISPAQITANQNDYSPTGLADAEIIRINSDAVNRQITGLATGAAKRSIVLVNVGSFDITLRYSSSSSSAANRFLFHGGKSLILSPLQSIELIYDATSSRWRSRTAPWSSSRVVLSGSVVNSDAIANTIADVTGLSFPVIAGLRYKFRFVIYYQAAATTTGSRWSINGPALSDLNYRSEYTLTATTRTTNDLPGTYDLPAASNASSLTEGNSAIIEGTIVASANGTVIARFASEVSASAITAVGDRSHVEYEIVTG